jgi:hypothetical protein
VRIFRHSEKYGGHKMTGVFLGKTSLRPLRARKSCKRGFETLKASSLALTLLCSYKIKVICGSALSRRIAIWKVKARILLQNASWKD